MRSRSAPWKSDSTTYRCDCPDGLFSGATPVMAGSRARTQIERERPNEFCGCGGSKQYLRCFAPCIMGIRPYHFWRDALHGN